MRKYIDRMVEFKISNKSHAVMYENGKKEDKKKKKRRN